MKQNKKMKGLKKIIIGCIALIILFLGYGCYVNNQESKSIINTIKDTKFNGSYDTVQNCMRYYYHTDNITWSNDDNGTVTAELMSSNDANVVYVFSYEKLPNDNISYRISHIYIDEWELTDNEKTYELNSMLGGY